VTRSRRPPLLDWSHYQLPGTTHLEVYLWDTSVSYCKHVLVSDGRRVIFLKRCHTVTILYCSLLADYGCSSRLSVWAIGLSMVLINRLVSLVVWLNGMSGILFLQCSDWFCRFYWSVNFFLLLLYEQSFYCVLVLLCAMSCLRAYYDDYTYRIPLRYVTFVCNSTLDILPGRVLFSLRM